MQSFRSKSKRRSRAQIHRNDRAIICKIRFRSVKIQLPRFDAPTGPDTAERGRYAASRPGVVTVICSAGIPTFAPPVSSAHPTSDCRDFDVRTSGPVENSPETRGRGVDIRTERGSVDCLRGISSLHKPGNIDKNIPNGWRRTVKRSVRRYGFSSGGRGTDLVTSA